MIPVPLVWLVDRYVRPLQVRRYLVEMAHYGNYNDARQSAPSMRELRLYGNVLKGATNKQRMRLTKIMPSVFGMLTTSATIDAQSENKTTSPVTIPTYALGDLEGPSSPRQSHEALASPSHRLDLRQDPPIADSYCSTTLAGMRPRSLTGMPWSFAHARTAPLC